MKLVERYNAFKDDENTDIKWVIRKRIWLNLKVGRSGSHNFKAVHSFKNWIRSLPELRDRMTIKDYKEFYRILRLADSLLVPNKVEEYFNQSYDFINDFVLRTKG